MTDTPPIIDRVKDEIIRDLESEASKEISKRISALIDERLGIFEKEIEKLLRHTIQTMLRETIQNSFPENKGSSSLSSLLSDGAQLVFGSSLSHSPSQQAMRQSLTLNKSSRLR